MITARDYALAELDAKRLPGWPPGLLKARGTAPAATPPADPRDRALGDQIIQGVLKNLLYLQWLTEHMTQRSLKRVDPVAQKVLAIGLYQLRFLSRVPSSAVVDEAVKQAKRVGHAHAAGFINAVLRKATRETDPPLPDRTTDPTGYAQVVLSHPKELYGRLEKLLGPADALRFCEHDNLEPPTIVRLYRGISPDALTTPEISVTPHQRVGMFIVSPARPTVLGEWAQRGIAQVQDPTAAQVVPQLQIEPGQVVLDRCCGLGTKTLQMQERVGNGSVVAMDPAEQRMRTLRQLLERRRIGNVRLFQLGMLKDIPTEQQREFERILVDAPCSNSGVLARRPEARYFQQDRAIASLIKLQNRIVEDTAPFLKKGGQLVYSTCSIWPEENQVRMAEFVKRHPDYHLIEEETTLPSFEADPTCYRDGGYFAVLERE